MQNGMGSRNLYFGHPFSKETYTNSVRLKTPFGTWESDFDGIYSGERIKLVPSEPFDVDDVETEDRVIRGTKVIFIGDYEKVDAMHSDMQVYKDLCNKATVRVNNPDYLDFETFTAKVLKDRLKDVFALSSVSPELAKKYMDYAILYDKDKKHSDRLIVKPYFVSCPEGVLVLTEDFVDFNIQLKVSVDLGVVGAEIWMSENTSHYLYNYKEI